MCSSAEGPHFLEKPGAGMRGDLAVNLQRYKNTPGPNSTVMDGGRRGLRGGPTHNPGIPLGPFQLQLDQAPHCDDMLL